MFGFRSKGAGLRPSRRFALQTTVELLEGRRLMAAGALVYHGGPLLDKAQVTNVFYGAGYTNPDNINLANSLQLNAFTKYFVQSPVYGQLSEYNVGKGTFVGSDTVVPVASTEALPSITDATIRTALAGEIKAGKVATPTAESVYVVYTEPYKEVFSNVGQNSVANFLGYHSSFTDPAGHVVNYAVVANPAGNATIPGLTSFNQQTEVTSHELSEAATDPHSNAWFTDLPFTTPSGKVLPAGQEIGDLANLNYGQEGNYTVQSEYSNARKAAYLAPDPPTIPYVPPYVPVYTGGSGSAGDPQLIFGLPVNKPPGKPLLYI